MLDKITLLSLGIRPDTDPNDPETWSDELKINHKRTLQSLGSRASDIAVKPKGKVSGKSGSFKPSTSKNPETGALSGDEIRQESERIKTALSQIDNSDLEKDTAPKGVNSTIWGSASDKSKKLIREYIKAHREFIARHQKNGQFPTLSNMGLSTEEDLSALHDNLGDIQSALGEEAYKRGERHPDPEGDFVVDPTQGKWYQERAVEDHKDELGRVKSAQLFASTYPIGFTDDERTPMGMNQIDFDNLSAPIKVPTIKLKQASSQDLKQEQATAEAAAAVKKPQNISDEELDDMEEMDGYECDTCGEPAIGYDEEEGYQCKSCYKDTHGTSATEDESEEESSTPVASSEPQGMPKLSSIKDDDVPQYTPGPYETDIDKIKSQFDITSSSTARKDGTPDFIANYTNPEVPGHTKLTVSAIVSPNATGRPNPNGGRLYSINWGGDSVTLANGKNSTKLVGWGTGQFGKGVPTGDRDEEFNLALHSVAKKIAEYHSKINGKLAGYTAPQAEEDNASESNEEDSSTSSSYVSPTYRGFAEHNRALQAIMEERKTHNKKSSGYAAVDSLFKSVMGGGGAYADTDEEERDRVTGLINQELTKHKKSSIMHTAISKIAKNLGYDLSSIPTVQERNQSETEAGSNVSAQMTEAGVAPAMSVQPTAAYQSGGSLSWKESLDKFNEWRAAKKVTYKDNGPAIRKIAKEIRAKSPGVVGHLLDLDDKFSSLTNNQRLAEDDPRKELVNNLRSAAQSIHSHISDKASSSPDKLATELPQSLRADHLLNETPTIAEGAKVGQPDKIDPNLWVTLSPDQKNHVKNYISVHNKVESFQLPNGQIAGSDESLSAYNEMHNYRRKLENSFGATGASKVGNEKYDVASRKVFDLLKEYPLGITRVF